MRKGRGWSTGGLQASRGERSGYLREHDGYLVWRKEVGLTTLPACRKLPPLAVVVILGKWPEKSQSNAPLPAATAG